MNGLVFCLVGLLLGVVCECKAVDGVTGGKLLADGECNMISGHHLNTFDGLDYTFHGTCVYQLAGVCSKDPSLQHFEVSVQNDGYGPRVGPGVKMVEVKVHENSIVLTRQHKGEVLINGELTNLPVPLKNNITVQLIGDMVEIKTKFGLQVSYDWTSIVQVKVPDRYADAMCGLCGNYNHNPKDDLKLKNGMQAASPAELGKSWRVSEVPDCADGCENEKDCPSCDGAQIQKYESDRYCGLIRKATGPFRECHATKNPDAIFKDCVYSMCLYKGKRGSWCSHMRTYTVECQNKGINVSQWRTDKFCPIPRMMHPDNSHYEHCGNVCHATCDTGLPPTGCKRPCQEAWVCKDGFLVSGNKCVPQDQCGCMYNDKYYRKGQSFLSSDCSQNCTCNGTVTCEKHSCGPSEKCALVKNVRSCQPVGNRTCTISGDPHYKTFDNRTYAFQGTCTYTAAKSCHLEGSNLTEFSVVVENEKWTRQTAEPNLAVAKLVAVEVYGYTLILRRNLLNVAMVNGKLTQLPISLKDGKLQVIPEGRYYAIVIDYSLKVTYDLVYRVTVTVPANYKGKTCGQCGSFTDTKTDEFELPDGKMTKDNQTFAAAWKVGVSGVVCENGCRGDQCPKCDKKQKEIFEKDCEIITKPNGTFAACHSRLSPESYYRDCVYDVCMAKGDRVVLCHSISAYMTDCQTIGVKIDHWRKPDFCPVKCSENSHYEICAETCASPCPGLTETITCPTTCAEGCTCNKGFKFNGTGCVALEDCSCYHNGRTYKIGESVVTDHCHQRCICTRSEGVYCEDYACGATEICQVKDGVLDCYPRECRIEIGGSITLFGGITSTISFMGSYEIIQHCDDTSVEWFRVVARFNECTLTGARKVVAIYAYFGELIVTVTGKHETWVNGRKVHLPHLLRDDISVSFTEKTIVIEKRSHFQLYYSITHEVIVTVSESMAGNVCGACGNLLPFKGTSLSLEKSQDYMRSFRAEDFSTCE